MWYNHIFKSIGIFGITYNNNSDMLFSVGFEDSYTPTFTGQIQKVEIQNNTLPHGLSINSKTGVIEGKANKEGKYRTVIRFYKTDKLFTDKEIKIEVVLPKCSLRVEENVVFTETNYNTNVSIPCGFIEVGRAKRYCTNSKTPEWSDLDKSQCSIFLMIKNRTWL